MSSYTRFFLLVFFTFCAFSPLYSIERLLGLSSRELLLSQGYPDDLVPTRGALETEDSILVQYNMGMTFILHKNYVSEIRLDKRYRGTALGLYMGMDYNQVSSVLKLSPASPNSEISANISDAMGQILSVKATFSQNKLTDISLSIRS